jgi:tetratricopeptide (TPR) repeat protein
MALLTALLAAPGAIAQAPDTEPAFADAVFEEEHSLEALLAAPSPGEAPEAVVRAWRDPAPSFEARVDQTRRAALEVGAWNLDPAARALIRGASVGTPLERAQGAVRLAPDLPAAHVALARALWIHGDAPMGAVRAVVAAISSAAKHPEASLWFAGSGLYMLSAALLGGGLLAILIAWLAVAHNAAHDLGHLLRVPVPAFAGLALLGALLLVPVVLGEGIVGLALAMLCVAMFYGSRGRRFALALAAAAVFCGLQPAPRLAADLLSAFPADPVARAAYSTAQGMASPVDLARLEGAADGDPLALRGLAIHARQIGNLGRADALYQQLLEKEPTDLSLVNNAANVRLDLGHMHSALELYDRALGLSHSPVVLFNVSQAHARSFQVDDLNRTLAEAQLADGELVADFTSLQRTKNQNFVVDLPLSAGLIWRRAIERGSGASLTGGFRARFAPGRLGGPPQVAAAGIAGVVALAWLLSLRFEGSGACTRCGRRQCPRCGHSGGGATLCGSCTRLFYQPEKTDRTLRTARIESLRAREVRLRKLSAVLSVVVPGAAGFVVERPVRGVVGSILFAFVVAAVFWRGGVVPDPMLFGPAAPIAFLGGAGVLGFLYMALVAASVARLRESSA